MACGHTAADSVVPVANSLLYAQAFAEHRLSTADSLSCDKAPAEEEYVSHWIPAFKKWCEVYFA